MISKFACWKILWRSIIFGLYIILAIIVIQYQVQSQNANVSKCVCDQQWDKLLGKSPIKYLPHILIEINDQIDKLLKNIFLKRQGSSQFLSISRPKRYTQIYKGTLWVRTAKDIRNPQIYINNY